MVNFVFAADSISSAAVDGSCASGSGVWDESSRTCTLTNNMHVTGLWGEGLSNYTLDCNGYSIHGYYLGQGDISLSYVTNFAIKNCQIYDFYTGVYIANSVNVAISNSQFFSNSHTGVKSYRSTKINLYDNNFFSNVNQDIFLQSSGDINFFRNNVQSENYSVYEENNSNINIFNNNFSANPIQIYSPSFSNIFENYWSDYPGQDLDGDNIGDTLLPHHGDNYPFVIQNGWLNSSPPQPDQNFEIISFSPEIEEEFIGHIVWNSETGTQFSSVEWAYNVPEPHNVSDAFITEEEQGIMLIAPNVCADSIYFRIHYSDGVVDKYSDWQMIDMIPHPDMGSTLTCGTTASSIDSYASASGGNGKGGNDPPLVTGPPLIVPSEYFTPEVGIEVVKFVTIGSCLDEGWVSWGCALDVGTMVPVFAPVKLAKGAKIVKGLDALNSSRKYIIFTGSLDKLAVSTRQFKLILNQTKYKIIGSRIKTWVDLGIAKLDTTEGKITIVFENLAEYAVKFGDDAIVRLKGVGVTNELMEVAIKNNANLDETLNIVKPQSKLNVAWLENGNSSKGLIHIEERHASQFLDNGIATDDIPNAIYNALKQPIKIQPSKDYRGGWCYFKLIEGTANYVRVVVASNGFVLTANPQSNFKCGG